MKNFLVMIRNLLAALLLTCTAGNVWGQGLSRWNVVECKRFMRESQFVFEAKALSNVRVYVPGIRAHALPFKITKVFRGQLSFDTLYIAKHISLGNGVFFCDLELKRDQPGSIWFDGKPVLTNFLQFRYEFPLFNPQVWSVCWTYKTRAAFFESLFGLPNIQAAEPGSWEIIPPHEFPHEKNYTEFLQKHEQRVLWVVKVIHT